jgi:DNA-binding LacI/PurR family transcriptional regulator
MSRREIVAVSLADVGTITSIVRVERKSTDTSDDGGRDDPDRRVDAKAERTASDRPSPTRSRGGRDQHGGRPAPRIIDIAAAAGVAASTVSRVLNDVETRVPIAVETRERVTAAARTLGYRPNPLARALRGAPTGLIGAVVRDFSDPFFAGAIEALAVEAMAHGYNVVLGHATGRLDEAIALPTVLETRHTDAVLVLGDMQDQPRLLADLRDSPVPVVALWHGTSPLEFPTVDVDDPAGVVIGLEHLIDLGHERIALVSATLPGNNLQRRDAYVAFMESRFGGIKPGYVQERPNTFAGGEAALAELLELPEPPTAVLATTDLVAIGVLHAAYRRGRTIPDELSVVGYDDIPIAAYTVPALTTVRMPIAEIIGEAVELAVGLARDPNASRAPRIRVYRPMLVMRDSTAAARDVGAPAPHS